MKCNKILIIGVPEGEEREQGMENMFEEIMTEDFPHLVGKKDRNSGSTESQIRCTQTGPHQDTS